MEFQHNSGEKDRSDESLSLILDLISFAAEYQGDSRVTVSSAKKLSDDAVFVMEMFKKILEEQGDCEASQNMDGSIQFIEEKKQSTADLESYYYSTSLPLQDINSGIIINLTVVCGIRNVVLSSLFEKNGIEPYAHLGFSEFYEDMRRTPVFEQSMVYDSDECKTDVKLTVREKNAEKNTWFKMDLRPLPPEKITALFLKIEHALTKFDKPISIHDVSLLKPLQIDTEGVFDVVPDQF